MCFLDAMRDQSIAHLNFIKKIQRKFQQGKVEKVDSRSHPYIY